jgi:chromosome segregation ATPase
VKRLLAVVFVFVLLGAMTGCPNTPTTGTKPMSKEEREKLAKDKKVDAAKTAKSAFDHAEEDLKIAELKLAEFEGKKQKLEKDAEEAKKIASKAAETLTKAEMALKENKDDAKKAELEKAVTAAKEAKTKADTAVKDAEKAAADYKPDPKMKKDLEDAIERSKREVDRTREAAAKAEAELKDAK